MEYFNQKCKNDILTSSKKEIKSLTNRKLTELRSALYDDSITKDQLSEFIKLSSYCTKNRKNNKDAIKYYLNSKTEEEKITTITEQNGDEFNVFGCDETFMMYASPIYNALLYMSDNNQDMAEAIFSCIDEQQKFEVLCNRSQISNERDIDVSNFSSLQDIISSTNSTKPLEFILDNIEPQTLIRSLTEKPDETERKKNLKENSIKQYENKHSKEYFEDPKTLKLVTDSNKIYAQRIRQELLKKSVIEMTTEHELPLEKPSDTFDNNFLQSFICSGSIKEVDMILQKVDHNELPTVIEKNDIWKSLAEANMIIESEKQSDTVYLYMGKALASAASEQSTKPINVKTQKDKDSEFDIDNYIKPSNLDLAKENPLEDHFGEGKMPPEALLAGFIEQMDSIKAINDNSCKEKRRRLPPKKGFTEKYKEDTSLNNGIAK